MNELLGRTLVIVAHPDDETVGCGALLQRMAEPVVIFCTDGAPRDEFFWTKFGSRLRYARHREEEARKALSIAGVNEMVFLAADQSGANHPTDQMALNHRAANPPPEELFVDQELYRAISDAVAALSAIVKRYRSQALLTLAYEGGHPDHDACSFIASVLARDFGLPAWEFPLYHRTQEGATVFQRFISQQFVGREAEGKHKNAEVVLELIPSEMECKRAMLAAHESQHPFLFEFDPQVERLRPQHGYDYSQPPHRGPLNYEAWGWPISGSDLVRAFGNFSRARGWHATAGESETIHLANRPPAGNTIV